MMQSPHKDPNVPVSATSEQTSILVIDDELGIRDLLEGELTLRGYYVSTAPNGKEALKKMRERRYDIAFCDINMPDLGGVEALAAFKQADPDMEVIMITGYATVETAVDAMKKGAYDFIAKPFHLEELITLVRRVREKSELRAMVAVYEASKAIYTSMDPQRILPLLTDLSQKLLHASEVCVLLKGDEGFTLASSSGSLSNEDQQSLLTRVSRGFSGQSERIVFPLPMEARKHTEINEATGKAEIFQPLIVDEKLLGVLYISRRETESWSVPELRSAMIFSSMAAQGVYNAQLFDRLQKKNDELEGAHAQIEEQQAQLVQAEKLAGLGQLAAGVAHELNNPLSGILGFTQILLGSSDLTPLQRQDLETIHAQSQRCRQIVQNLLEFSRRKKTQIVAANAVDLLEQTLKLVRYDFSTSAIELVTEFPPDLPRVSGDESKLQQVFLNLITNARQAMENIKNAQLRITAAVEGEYVVFRFTDNGCGIKGENLSKIFDPFFTTKPVGKGTGLGLSICHGIVQQHKGELSAHSEAGQGTTFVLKLRIYETK
jgi:signal transduction histidine kinase